MEDSVLRAGWHLHYVRRKVVEKLDDMHMNPDRAGLVEKAVDWKWSSARSYVEGKSVGLPIRWPPGLEMGDEFDVSR
ncbi:MAG: hypothetical protein CMJ48_05695 [Planctomycetaceae bacterium]|nr:hypothetical protein [Planctomycetaceae bacterium]